MINWGYRKGCNILVFFVSRICCLVIAILLTVVICGIALSAKVEGVVVLLESNSLTVRLDSGKEVTVTVHSQGICIKERRRVNLPAFKTGERVVIIPTGEYASKNLELLTRIEALAIQDAVSYGMSKGGSIPVSPPGTVTAPPSKPQTNIYDDPFTGISPELRDKLLTYLPDGKLPNIGDTGPGGSGTGVGGYDFISPQARNSGPVETVPSPTPLPLNQNNSSSQNKVSNNMAPLKFSEREGRISEINISGNTLAIIIPGSNVPFNITTSEKTKIYRFTNNQFEFLSLSQLKIGDKVKASGFRQGEGVLDAMMIILLSK